MSVRQPASPARRRRPRVRPFQILWSAFASGTALALKVCTPGCVRLDLSTSTTTRTLTHTDALPSLSRQQHSLFPLCSQSALYPPLPSSSCPRPQPQTAGQAPGPAQATYLQTLRAASTARPGPVGPLRSATSTFITQLTTEHSRSAGTARGPLSVSYKGEIVRGGRRKKKRESRSRIRVPTSQGPVPRAQPQSLWPSKPQIPRLPWAPWAELAPRSPESRHATLTASPFRHSHPHLPGAALPPRLASAPALLDMRMPMRIQSR